MSNTDIANNGGILQKKRTAHLHSSS